MKAKPRSGVAVVTMVDVLDVLVSLLSLGDSPVLLSFLLRCAIFIEEVIVFN